MNISGLYYKTKYGCGVILRIVEIITTSGVNNDSVVVVIEGITSLSTFIFSSKPPNGSTVIERRCTYIPSHCQVDVTDESSVCAFLYF